MAVYEVMRVMNGVVLFLDDHLIRLEHSAMLSGFSLPFSTTSLAAQIRALIEAHALKEGNIQVLVSNTEGGEYSLKIVPHQYPAAAEYAHGVRLGLLRAERVQPNAKQVHTMLRAEADALMVREGVREVVLVHPRGYITEGSRTNFFLIRDETVYTAPLEDVLGGITRVHILEVCRRLGFQVREERIAADHLSSFAAAFLSGTSLHILPVRQVASISFDASHPVLKALMKGFAHYVDEYLSEHSGIH